MSERSTLPHQPCHGVNHKRIPLWYGLALCHTRHNGSHVCLQVPRGLLGQVEQQVKVCQALMIWFGLAALQVCLELTLAYSVVVVFVVWCFIPVVVSRCCLWCGFSYHQCRNHEMAVGPYTHTTLIHTMLMHTHYVDTHCADTYTLFQHRHTICMHTHVYYYVAKVTMVTLKTNK